MKLKIKMLLLTLILSGLFAEAQTPNGLSTYSVAQVACFNVTDGHMWTDLKFDDPSTTGYIIYGGRKYLADLVFSQAGENYVKFNAPYGERSGTLTCQVTCYRNVPVCKWVGGTFAGCDYQVDFGYQGNRKNPLCVR